MEALLFFLLWFFIIGSIPYCIGVLFYIIVRLCLHFLKIEKSSIFEEYNISVFVMVFSTIVPLAGIITFIELYRFEGEQYTNFILLLNAGQICWAGLIFQFIAICVNKKIARILLLACRVFLIGMFVAAGVFSFLYIFSTAFGD